MGKLRDIKTDLCVIGGGSGGLSVAAGAAKLGARVVLVEAARMGGDCLNTGCVPSKALIAAASSAQSMREAGRFGLAPAEPRPDWARVAAHVHRTITAIAPHDSQERFEALGVRVIRARARFVSPRAVQAGDVCIRARRFVIATGSRPRMPPLPGLADVACLTSDTVFDLSERPGHLLVMGAGPVGLELAQAFRRLGAEVTVVEPAQPLGGEDREAATVVLDRLRAEGVRLLDGKVNQVAGKAGDVRLRLEGGELVEGSHLLVATGRVPALDGLDLERAGIRFGPEGLETDDRLRTSNRRVLAVGDAAGRGRFTHLAAYQAGIVLRRVLFGLPARLRTGHIPRVTYTDPELAQVGLTEAEARKKHGFALGIVQVPVERNDRAQTQAEVTGFIKIMVVRGRPVGATIVGADAGELIAFWSLALSSRLRMRDIAGTILPYPTLNELNTRAAGAYFSPKLFDNPVARRVVGLVQRLLP